MLFGPKLHQVEIIYDLKKKKKKKKSDTVLFKALTCLVRAEFKAFCAA